MLQHFTLSVKISERSPPEREVVSSIFDADIIEIDVGRVENVIATPWELPAQRDCANMETMSDVRGQNLDKHAQTWINMYI